MGVARAAGGAEEAVSCVGPVPLGGVGETGGETQQGQWHRESGLPCCCLATAPLRAIPVAPSPSASPDWSPLSLTGGKGLRTRRLKEL